MKRRNNGAGHIRQKSDGRWEALYYVNGERRYIQGRKGETAADVQRRLNEALHNLDRGIEAPKDNRVTVGEWMDRWLATIKANPKRSYSYYVRSECVTRLFIKPAVGNIPLTKLTAQQIEGLYAHVRGLGRAENTVKKVHIALRAALAHAMRDGLIMRNVASLVEAPVGKPEMKVYTVEQVNRLFAVAQGDRLEALYILLPSTGCRLGELLGRRWEDLDLDKAEMNITGALKDVAGRLWLGDTKTPSSHRTVPLTALAVESLRRHKTAQIVERLKHSAGWNPNNLVFCTTNGTPFSQTNTRKYYIRLLRQAGLPIIKRHEAGRHTNATIQLSNGAPLHEVGGHLGHTTPVTTLGIYAHVLPGATDRTRTRIEQAFGNQNKEVI